MQSSLCTFARALYSLDRLSIKFGCVQGCHVGVIALSDPADQLMYNEPIVDYDLRYDLDMPSTSMLEAVHFMHKASYTHVIIQQVCAAQHMIPVCSCLHRVSQTLRPSISRTKLPCA